MSFRIVLIFFLVVLTVYVHEANAFMIVYSNGTVIEQTDLSWRIAGFSLSPGYRYGFTLNSEVNDFPGGALASGAGIRAGPLTIELKPEVGQVSVKLVAIISYNGRVEYRHEVCRTWFSGGCGAGFMGTITYCNGRLVVDYTVAPTNGGGEPDSGRVIVPMTGIHNVFKFEERSCLPLGIACVQSRADVYTLSTASCPGSRTSTLTAPPRPPDYHSHRPGTTSTTAATIVTLPPRVEDVLAREALSGLIDSGTLKLAIVSVVIVVVSIYVVHPLLTARGRRR